MNRFFTGKANDYLHKAKALKRITALATHIFTYLRMYMCVSKIQIRKN